MNGKNKNFDVDSKFESSVKTDFVRVVNRDDEEREFISYEKVDYPAIIERNGTMKDWSLQSLLKAGINPDFGIHTVNNTRLEGFNTVQDAAAMADSIFAESEEQKNEE